MSLRASWPHSEVGRWQTGSEVLKRAVVEAYTVGNIAYGCSLLLGLGSCSRIATVSGLFYLASRVASVCCNSLFEPICTKVVYYQDPFMRLPGVVIEDRKVLTKAKFSSVIIPLELALTALSLRAVASFMGASAPLALLLETTAGLVFKTALPILGLFAAFDAMRALSKRLFPPSQEGRAALVAETLVVVGLCSLASSVAPSYCVPALASKGASALAYLIFRSFQLQLDRKQRAGSELITSFHSPRVLAMPALDRLATLVTTALAVALYALAALGAASVISSPSWLAAGAAGLATQLCSFGHWLVWPVLPTALLASGTYQAHEQLPYLCEWIANNIAILFER